MLVMLSRAVAQQHFWDISSLLLYTHSGLSHSFPLGPEYNLAIFVRQPGAALYSQMVQRKPASNRESQLTEETKVGLHFS